MERLMNMLLVGVVAAVILQCATAQTVHVVGDNIGWTIPSNGAEGYITWASSKTFLIGDTLIFNFATNAHDVVQVPKASFDTCSDDNEIGNPITIRSPPTSPSPPPETTTTSAPSAPTARQARNSPSPSPPLPVPPHPPAPVPPRLQPRHPRPRAPPQKPALRKLPPPKPTGPPPRQGRK
ncbi:hypothetical protein Acr_11g0013430 [Actinidia rufa]|uniref:Phytocyanin domain-containing protein n=1 Tax=Actinidia rufa TaxID=165716 RepID=A0A7J0FGK2_9ERIC|nr:hypothetical protein Acr_11g0013430 [Actinidia rufa]